MTTQYNADTFAGRTVSGGWGTASDGTTTYTVASGSASALNVGSNEGTITYPGSSTTYYIVFGSAQTDIDLVVRCSVGNTNNTNYVVFRYQNSTNMYRLSVDSGSILLTKIVSGSNTTLYTGSTSGITASNFFYIHVRVVGSTIMANYWLSTGSEGAGWLVNVTDTTYTSGQCGLGATIRASSSVSFDSLVVLQAFNLKQAPQAKFAVKAPFQIQSRDNFKVAAALKAQSRAKFLVQTSMKAQARSKFAVRVPMGIGARSRFLIKIGLSTQARSKFLVRTALKLASQARFLVKLPTQLFFGKVNLVLPNNTYWVEKPYSTVQSVLTATDQNNQPITGVTINVTVQFPDYTTATFTQANLFNPSTGIYQLTYQTKGPGIVTETWSCVSIDGTVIGEYVNTYRVSF